MNIEKQVCSLEQAKKLKELGVGQTSLFSFFGDEEMRLRDNGKDAQYSDWIFIQNTVPVNNQQGDWRVNVCCENPIASAFTIAELGELLSGYDDVFIDSRYDNHGGYWRCDYAGYVRKESDVSAEITTIHTIDEQEEESDNEAFVRAEMLIYLLENNVIAIS